MSICGRREFLPAQKIALSAQSRKETSTRDKRMRLVGRAAPSRSFYILLLPLSVSLPLFSLSTAIVAVITIFLRPPSGLSCNDLSIESRAGNHRTSANGTANGCVLLVPLHLPHYTQFSAGDLIGFPLLILLLRPLLLPACSLSPPSFFCFYFVRSHLRNRSKDLFFPSEVDCHLLDRCHFTALLWWISVLFLLHSHVLMLIRSRIIFFS